MNNDRITDLYQKAAEENNQELLEAIDWVFEQRKIIRNLGKEIAEAFNEFEAATYVTERTQRDLHKAHATLLKMYRDPENAREIYIKAFGDPDED